MTQPAPMTVREQAKAWGVSLRYATMARYVQKHRPLLFELIGTVYSIGMAYEIARDEVESGGTTHLYPPKPLRR